MTDDAAAPTENVLDQLLKALDEVRRLEAKSKVGWARYFPLERAIDAYRREYETLVAENRRLRRSVVDLTAARDNAAADVLDEVASALDVELDVELDELLDMLEERRATA